MFFKQYEWTIDGPSLVIPESHHLDRERWREMQRLGERGGSREAKAHVDAHSHCPGDFSSSFCFSQLFCGQKAEA